MFGRVDGEPSKETCGRVKSARVIQRERFGHMNVRMSPREIRLHCRFDDECQELLKMAMTELNFSARAYDRILNVSRKIADLDRSECIQSQHIIERLLLWLLIPHRHKAQSVFLLFLQPHAFFCGYQKGRILGQDAATPTWYTVGLQPPTIIVRLVIMRATE
jgi:hypothetical protein